jgi:cytochrome c biogenesis protein ResB
MKPQQTLGRLASTRLTLLGMAMLAVGAGLSYGNPDDVSAWVLIGPLLFLALNLLAAIITHPGINRRPGLLLFHIGLLSICILAAIGRLTHYEARVEVSQDSAFDPATIQNIKRGPWHTGELGKVRFVQQGYTVDYRKGLVRGKTRDHILVPDGRGGWKQTVIGDDTPLVIDGYRFYTTFNKGFAAVLTWVPKQGEPITGTLHMPSYPLFEYRQANTWTPPGGNDEIKFWLRLETGYDMKKAWVMDVNRSKGVLVVNDGGERRELQPGEGIDLPGGYLRYEALSSWMGFKIFYDPTLRWLFGAAMMVVFGLVLHYWSKFRTEPLAEPNAKEADGQSRIFNQKVTNV